MAAPDPAPQLSKDSSCTGGGVHTCPSLGGLGWGVPGQPRERGPQQERANPEGQCSPADDLGGGGDLGRTVQRQLLAGQIPPPESAPRRLARGPGDCPQDPEALVGFRGGDG